MKMMIRFVIVCGMLASVLAFEYAKAGWGYTKGLIFRDKTPEWQ